jgi:hypothetical protein
MTMARKPTCWSFPVTVAEIACSSASSPPLDHEIDVFAAVA